MVHGTYHKVLIYMLVVAVFMGFPSFLWAYEDDDTIVISGDEIRSMKAHKVSDIFNHVPGVTAGDSSVSIHGSSKVKVLLNGVPLNDPAASHGSIRWDLVVIDEIDRIEILRGKGSLRYGQDTSGGVILITTKKYNQLKGNIKLYGGSHGTVYTEANMQTAIKGVSVGMSGSFETTDGYTINNDKRRWRTGAKGGYDSSGGGSIALSVDHAEDTRGLSGLPDYPTPHSRKETVGTISSLDFAYENIKGKVFYNDSAIHNTDISKQLDQTLNVKEFGQDLTGKFGRFDLGLSHRMNLASGTTFEDKEERAFSIFGSRSFDMPFFPAKVMLGLRFNEHSYFDDVINPEITITYKKPRWCLSASYNRTNNIPSFYQRYNKTSSTNPSPYLQMETSDNISGTLSADITSHISFNATPFYNILKDRITYITGDDGIGQYQNVGKVTYKGVDLAVTVKPHNSIALKVAYTLLDVKDEETGLRLPAVPQHSITLNVSWQVTDKLSLVGSSKAVSKVYRNRSNTKSVPGYAISDIRGEYAFSRLTIFAKIENLFDKQYYYADGLLAPPLTFFIGLNWKI